MPQLHVKRSKVTISAAIFIVALLVRVVPMGMYVTPDEPIWVLRSLRFYDAVTSGNLADIPQTGHPGITTMWLGTLAIGLRSMFAPHITEQHLVWLRNVAWLTPENSEAFQHLYYFLPTARLLAALTSSICVGLLYWILEKRVAKRTAELAALFVALTPFLAGLSGLLHTDALQASFGMLGLALALPQRDGKHFHAWYTIGLIALCLVLSGLSKSLGWLIAPGAALILLFTYRGKWWQRIAVAALLTLATFAFLYVLYPPMWYQPVEAFKTLVGAVGYHEDLGLRDVFFLDEMRTDPGWLFYPLVLLFRLMPPVLMGVFVGWKRTTDEQKLVRWLWLPVMIYLLAISIATKKFDRYATSVFPMLAIIAAVNLKPLLNQRWMRNTLLVLLLLPIALTLVLPLYYADPLVGGPWLAQHVIPLGWGEGAGLAARELNNRQVPTMMTDNVPGAASFFNGPVYAWDDELLPCVAAYTGEQYRTSETITLGIAGIPMTYVTENFASGNEYPKTDFEARLCAAKQTPYDADIAFVATFDGNLDLLAYHISADNQAPDALSVMFRWLPQRQLDVRDLYIVLHGVNDNYIWDQGGMELISTNGWRAETWLPLSTYDAEAYIPLDLTLPPGTYQVGLRLIGNDGNYLGITDANGVFKGVELNLGEVEIQAPRYTVEAVDLPEKVEIPFIGGAVIAHSTLPDTRYAGDDVMVELGLFHDRDTPVEPVTWFVECDDGSSLSDEVFDVQAFAKWPAYHRYILPYEAPLPADMPDTHCNLELRQDNQLLGNLGTFEVLSRERDFTFDTAPERALQIVVGDFANLTGADISAQLSESLDVALYWVGSSEIFVDYTVFIQLIAPDGSVETQIDAYPAAGRAPTSTWIPGQAIYDAHSLSVPAALSSGEYLLIAGMYDAQSGVRAPLYDSQGRLDGDYIILAKYTVD